MGVLLTALAIASTTGSSWTGWIIGLACGVALMFAFDVDWRRLPERAQRFAVAVRRKSGWAAVAAGSLGVILFY
jgi:hypothetical protein